MQPSARVLLDSSYDTHRVTTMEVVFHRNVLAEFNTHRNKSRNSASSRAIPIEKMLARAMENPAWPLEWSRDQPGMQGGAELEGDDLIEAIALLENIAAYTCGAIDAYVRTHPDRSTRLHKSYLNRPLEWFSWHTAIVTAVEWDNFFKQRCHPKAQKEIRVVAELMREALHGSTPTQLAEGEWHTPLIQPDEFELPLEIKLPVSAARCGRVSYLTHDGVRSLDKDLDLFYDTLMEGILDPENPPHWSPLEHVCTPTPGLFVPGNLGTAYQSLWAQLRHYDPLGVWTNRPVVPLGQIIKTGA
jgi:hypothetical protein